jgi:hypothetical protein
VAGTVTCSITAAVAAATTATVWVLVGVELDEVCQHGHALTPCPETT